MPVRRNPWNRLAWDTWMLGMEAGAVVALRAAKLAKGGAAGEAEASRMVAEKTDAFVEWQLLALSGALGPTAPGAASKTLKHYRRRVRANRHRLSG